MNETKLDPQSRYYDVGGIETLDVIRAKLTHEQFQGYCLGNMIKYACRANYKGNFKRDCVKIGFYQGFLQAVEEEEPADRFEDAQAAGWTIEKDDAGIIKCTPDSCANLCGKGA